MNEKLYFDDVLDSESSLSDLDGVNFRMEKLDKQIRKLRKKKGKGGKNGKKKLKKKLKKLKREYRHLEQLLLYSVYQGQMPSNPTPQQRIWWQEALTNSLPKAIELAAVSVNKLPSKK